MFARRAKAEYLVGTRGQDDRGGIDLLPYRTFDKAVRKQMLGS